ncbi:MAG: L-aspartate oxidase [Acidimicrobiales bacterium]
MPQDSDRGAISLDVLVVGSGVAGLFAGLALSRVEGVKVGVLTKGELSQSATRWAQGGIAAVLPGDEDSTDLHIADTLAAGHDLCDLDAVRVLVEEGPDAIVKLIGAGMMFDRDTIGNYLRAREGGHSTARVLHAGGVATGAEVERALVEAVRDSDLAVMEGWFSLDLIVEGGRCKGVYCIDATGHWREVRAGAVLLATGGAGQLYSVTTNPLEATGDGVAMALRAGIPVADVEFFQFHPTALYHPGIPRPLLSEALRGHGAVLRDKDGKRFVDELLPRDQVSRAMARQMIEQGVPHLWLDATQLERFDERFPTISEELAAARLDPVKDWLPVSPAAHYISGGLLTDLDGATACAGLFAAGEVACTGVHGANRLASNSLLEGLVYGLRAARAIIGGKDRAEATGAMRGWMGVPCRVGCVAIEAMEKEPAERVSIDLPVPGISMYDGIRDAARDDAARGNFQAHGARSSATHGDGAQGSGAEGNPGSDRTRSNPGSDRTRSNPGSDRTGGSDAQHDGEDAGHGKARERFQEAMTRGAGVLRSAASLEEAARVVEDTIRAGSTRSGNRDDASYRDDTELRNLCTVAAALIRSAYCRRETRGAHARVEHPTAADSGIVRIVHGQQR